MSHPRRRQQNYSATYSAIASVEARIEKVLECIRADVTPNASYETRRNAVVVLLEIGNVFYEDGEQIEHCLMMSCVVDRCLEILLEVLRGLDGEQRRFLREELTEEGESIRLFMEKTVKLARAYCIMDGFQECWDVLVSESAVPLVMAESSVAQQKSVDAASVVQDQDAMVMSGNLATASGAARGNQPGDEGQGKENIRPGTSASNVSPGVVADDFEVVDLTEEGPPRKEARV